MSTLEGTYHVNLSKMWQTGFWRREYARRWEMLYSGRWPEPRSACSRRAGKERPRPTGCNPRPTGRGGQKQAGECTGHQKKEGRPFFYYGPRKPEQKEVGKKPPKKPTRKTSRARAFLFIYFYLSKPFLSCNAL